MFVCGSHGDLSLFSVTTPPDREREITMGMYFHTGKTQFIIPGNALV
jgi:hypothetical protein